MAKSKTGRRDVAKSSPDRSSFVRAAPLRPPMRRRPVAPVVGPLLGRATPPVIERLLGFWVLWNSYGGTRELIAWGGLSRSGVMAQLADFKRVFGCWPDEWQPVLAGGLFASDLPNLLAGYPTYGSDQPLLFEEEA